MTTTATHAYGAAAAAPLAAALPADVSAPLLQLLGWLGWLVALLCVARVIWCAGLLGLHHYRGENTEGLIGALLAGVLLGSAGTVAGALYAPP